MALSALRLGNNLELELARLHGSPEAAQAYRKRGQMPAKPADGIVQNRVAVVSDLHLGAGRKPDGGYHPGDDFTNTQERQFINYLAAEWEAAATGRPKSLHSTYEKISQVSPHLKWANGEPANLELVAHNSRQKPYDFTLCINGDFIDFLQTAVERPGLRYPDGFDKNNKAPKNTPANAIVQLNVIRQGHPQMFRALATHIRLGHRLDIIPGNHDRHLWNKYVWEGSIKCDGKKVGGFMHIMREEIEALIRDEQINKGVPVGKIRIDQQEVTACLARVLRLPSAVYGDKWVQHGDMADDANKLRRPYKEVVDPTPLHEEMEMSLGDYGVRNGFNELEILDPTLDAIDNTPKLIWQAMKHPRATFALLMAFLKGSKAEGYDISQEADAEQRLRDIETLVRRYPQITQQLNTLRPADEQLSIEETITGLQEIDKASPTPFFSNFKKGTGIFSRLCTLIKGRITGKRIDRPTDDWIVERGAVAQKHFKTNEVVAGHTHQARNQSYVTAQERLLRYINTHTWMTKVGKWGRPSITWGASERGVAIIELGVDQQNRRFCELSLNKVCDETGHLVEGDIHDDPDVKPRVARKQAEALYSANHPDKQKP